MAGENSNQISFLLPFVFHVPTKMEKKMCKAKSVVFRQRLAVTKNLKLLYRHSVEIMLIYPMK